MIQQAIHDVIEGQDLSFEAAREVMNEIMSGEDLRQHKWQHFSQDFR